VLLSDPLSEPTRDLLFPTVDLPSPSAGFLLLTSFPPPLDPERGGAFFSFPQAVRVASFP